MARFLRLLGGVLLISGTTIGAGALALPVVSSFTGFFPSMLLLTFMWMLMLCTGFFFLDVTMSIQEETNLVSMAQIMLGRGAKVGCWVVYLLLLYCLNAAFIAGSSRLFSEGFEYVTGVPLPEWIAPLLMPLLFGGFVYLGTRGVDYINRILMIGLFAFYFLLVSILPEHVDVSLLHRSEFSMLFMGVPIVITSFGYHVIIPSLVTYFKRDVKLLRWTILWGSFIPLFIYAVWQCLVMGIVPFNVLEAAWIKGSPATVPLAVVVNSPWIQIGARFFSFFAIVTSFLGTSLGLSDFLTDGLKLGKNWSGRMIACTLTLLPPLFFVYVSKRGFYSALQYGGIFVALLIGVFPAVMAWRLKNHFYQSFFGRIILGTVIVSSVAIIAINFILDFSKVKIF